MRDRRVETGKGDGGRKVKRVQRDFVIVPVKPGSTFAGLRVDYDTG